MSLFTSDVIVDNASIPVTGTFWQATQPVSGSVAVSSVGGSVAVTGTFWQATQPVSGSVSVSNFPATQAVTGTFWQATQPVSIAGSVAVTGPLTDTQLRATPVPVSGTVTTTPVTSNSATVAQVTSTGSNQTILAANSNRKKAILMFETGIWSVKFGATASTTSLTYKVSANNTTIEVDTWTGIIDAICTTAGKLVDVTELV
jgi:hypothetical protein